jgi:hypothetical protein
VREFRARVICAGRKGSGFDAIMIHSTEVLRLAIEPLEHFRRDSVAGRWAQALRPCPLRYFRERRRGLGTQTALRRTPSIRRIATGAELGGVVATRRKVAR